MPTVLVTGSSGLVGSECVRHFAAQGWAVHGIDSNARRTFFGPDGDTGRNCEALRRAVPGFQFHDADLRGVAARRLINEKPDLIIHAAGQPSHDYAADHPLEDFEANALGTLWLLQSVRDSSPNTVFCFLSTNKVYGDLPNQAGFAEYPTRWDVDDGGSLLGWPGFDETLSVDQSTHSLFGCSKLAADLYTQEYGRYFGLSTVCFRCGCLTGGAHAGAEQHGFLAYLARCVREGRPYRIYGYKGKQVRDQLHAVDVARACHEFFKHPRQCGPVYNLGGGRDNSVSVVEAIDLFERATGKRLAWEYVDRPRRGDHVWWVSDTTKFRTDFPGWSVSRSLPQIVAELVGV